LLTDGLRAEREQKITIDVAYRTFATAKRRYLLADTPGHARYTRNMFTGVSTAEAVILLLDAERGPTRQTYLHAFIASLLGMPHVLVAVNKMDLVGYEQDAFEARAEEFRAGVHGMEFADLRFLPVSAVEGEGIVSYRGAMPWFHGPSVLHTLDDLEAAARPYFFRFPVQGVVRPGPGLRGLMGEACSGAIRVGEMVQVLPSGETTSVVEILSPDGPVESCTVGDPVIVVLADDLDVGRGAMLVRPKNPATVAHSAEAMVVWMSEDPARLRSPYRVLSGTASALGTIGEIAYRVAPDTLHREAADSLELNHVGKVSLRFADTLCLDVYRSDRTTGSFELLSVETGEVMAAGVVLRVPALEPGARSERGLCVWMTGLSGAGKSTLSDLTAARLRAAGVAVVQLDGDALRAGLNRDLAFSESDRTENIRRTAEVARLLASQGVVVICSLISPMRSQRELAAEIVGDAWFEVFVDCPLEVAEARDVKGLYARARRGEIAGFTGVSSPYEPPDCPALRLLTSEYGPGEAAQRLVDFVNSRIFLARS
ncbi:MAG: adenylyl-sulfate kinase, partial [Fimbriimonadaceae bacterium]|nr:adenylyl-sulfate kinase [Fimbriimonadaceae bacterium]